MSKTNKTIIIGLVAVAAAYAGSSWYLGKQIQTGIENTVVDANQRYINETFSGLKNDTSDLITLISYDRGLFSSNAKYKLSLTNAKGKSIEYEINSDIDHGFFPIQALSNGIYTPLLAYANTSLNATSEMAQQLNLTQDTVLASTVTKAKVNGDSHSVMSLLPISVDIDDDVSISFSGANINFDLQKHQSNINIDGVIDSYVIQQKSINEVMTIKDMSFDSQIKLLDTGNAQQTAINIDSIELSSENNDIETNAKNINVNIDSEQINNVFNGNIKYDIQKIFIDNKDLGNFIFGVNIKNIDLPSLISLSQKYSELIEFYDVASINDLNLSTAEQNELLGQIRPLLALKPSLTIDPLLWGNQSGTSQAAFNISIAGSDSENNDTIDIEKIIENASFNLDVSRAMVMEVFKVLAEDNDGAQGAEEVGAMLFDQYAELLTSQGLAVQDDDKLSISIKVNPLANEASINDKIMTLNEFFMLAFGLAMFL